MRFVIKTITMKNLLLLIQLVFSVPFICFSQTNLYTSGKIPGISPISVQKKMPKSVTENWESAAQMYISKSEYFFRKMADQYAAANRNQQIGFAISEKKLTTRPIIVESDSKVKQWSSSIEILQIGKNTQPTQVTSIICKDDYLRFQYNEFDIEYINDEKGLKQNFIIKQRPEYREKLQLLLNISGDLKPSLFDEKTLKLSDKKDKTILQYDGLKVWDAHHRVLEASMQLKGDNQLEIVVNDQDAVYPVTIDPLTHSAEWAGSAEGLLPAILTTLQLQIDAMYGYSIAGVGDVNGDGFDDVAIGAPGTIDIIAGPTVIAGAGAVFVYFGSDTGLHVTPQRILRATTPVANALFGFSVAGGNVAGDAKKDIVVGAPGESYSTAVSGIPSTATVTAGKVYTFRGQDLAAGTTTPFASIFLNGSGYFSNGIAGVLLSNTSINALFGFSVAATEDMTGDNLGEIVVGVPGYAGVQLTDVRTGAAFVYYSSNIVSNTPVRLNAPTLLGFSDLVNLNGLLFGFSVDGAGDYNHDTNPDIVVGAPGGLNLGVPGLLGGSAYIYGGNGSGVSTSIVTRLKTAGSIVGSVANLFGYCVKGVRDSVGNRNGNIIVGAPVGSVLSNVTNGLRLKTGDLHVFLGKASPGTSETPTQSFSSPRSASLLSILGSLNLNVNSMFGASIDNMLDANCDGIGDIIVGEPLSTGVGLVGANAVGGAAYIFLGNANGTYNTIPHWTLENTVSFDFGINAGSMVGYSVAGSGHIKGMLKSVRALVGAPGKALDFSTGVFNLGNTFGTLFSFVAGNNGLGKAYAYNMGCDVLVNPDINATHVNVSVAGNVSTNDVVVAGTVYGTPVANGSNPSGGIISMNADGTYTFIASNPGVYVYTVPICIPGHGCTTTLLTITVLDLNSTRKPPIANTDIAATRMNTAVAINSLANDASGNVGGSLNPASVTVTAAPLHGTTSVNTTTGAITYTPASGYIGMDTLTYTVCDNAQPTPQCATAKQIIYVKEPNATNSTMAADDFINIPPNVAANGNVKLNDTDPEGNTQTVTTQTTTVTGKGTLVLNADGSYTFTPVSGFTGPVSFTYTTCDNGTPQACASATLHILVTPWNNPDLTTSSRINNGTFIRSQSTIRNFVMEVSEIWGNITDNASIPVQMQITKSANINYLFDPVATTMNAPSAIPINNSDWDLITNNSSIMLFQLKSGRNINPYTASRIGIRLQVLTNATIGTEIQVFVVTNGSGTELMYNNNKVERILNIVP